MQIANVMLMLGGDKGNTVPKYNVTPAEVAVLQYIHGGDAVYDIEPVGEIERTHRAERQRLLEVYGRRNERGLHVAEAVEALFPGAASRVFETFAELELPAEFYKAASRVVPVAATRSDPLDHDGDGRKGGSLKKEEREQLGLAGMTKQQLLDFAKERGIEVSAQKAKAEVLAAIQAALAAPAAPEPQPEPESEPEEDDGIRDMADAEGIMD